MTKMTFVLYLDPRITHDYYSSQTLTSSEADFFKSVWKMSVEITAASRRGAAHQLSHVNNKEQVKLEESVGIKTRLSPPGNSWTGKMRVRFTDFQVHEILLNGKVVHLSDYSEPEDVSTHMYQTYSPASYTEH